MPKHNPQINSEIKTIKTFSYALGDLTLTFTLNVDSAKDLNSFYSMLMKAAEDIAKIEESTF